MIVADAMFCQREIYERIFGDGDYPVIIKGRRRLSMPDRRFLRPTSEVPPTANGWGLTTAGVCVHRRRTMAVSRLTS